MKPLVVLFVWSWLILPVILSAGESGYFQQYVRYRMTVDLNTDDHSVAVQETLLYRNQSPDTLRELYFHLYLNKYRAGSLALPELEFDTGGIDLLELSVNDRVTKNYQIDQTLMLVPLDHPLTPGDSVSISFTFIAMIPPASGRYGYQGMHYDVGNWYITPVVYDRFGWHLHQHLDNEFYQEWGDFRVTIRVPQDFFVGGTGKLLNESDVIPAARADTPGMLRAGSEDTVLVPWEFEAKNVHDFAWTTDPSYILEQVEWDGITLNILILDYNQESWQEVAEWGGQALQYLCQTFGRYPYDQLTVADTYIRAGGIEYPQIVMINDYINPDFEPGDFRAVIIHEMAHNWFYGLLGNNQLEHEWLDEGFTTFAEIKTMEHLFGREGNLEVRNRGWFFDHFGYRNDVRRDNLLSYLELAKFNQEEDPIDLHADYLGPAGYTLQYSKAGNVLFLLEYVLGDSVFSAVMLRYFERWRYRHPYPEDFIAVVEEVAGCDLHWFFEQWLKTDRKLDYAIDDISLREEGDSLAYTISLTRKEKIFMPVDLHLVMADGSTCVYRIPVDEFGCRPPDRQLLPYWHFSRTSYEAEIKVAGIVEQASIDPVLTQMDINQLDNTSSWFPRTEWYFMRVQHAAPPTDAYLWELWPLAFYNDIDKIKLGMNLKGSYLDIDHLTDLRFWFKTATLNIDFDLTYEHPVKWFGDLSWVHLQGYILDGREGAKLGLRRKINRKYHSEMSATFDIGAHHLSDRRYLMNVWDDGWETNISLGWEYRSTFQRWKPKENLTVSFKTSTFGSDYDFSLIYLQGSRKFWNGYSDLELDLRVFSGYGAGEVPHQHLFNLSGDNSWGEFGNDFYRAKGSLPWPWRRNGNLYKTGGGNIRGYSLSRDPADQLGMRILAVNLDIKLPNPLGELNWPVIRDIYPGLFVDYGKVWDRSWPKIEDFDASAGLGLTWEVWDWLDYFFNMKAIRFDFPVWINHAPAGERSFDFRWLIRFDFN